MSFRSIYSTTKTGSLRPRNRSGNVSKLSVRQFLPQLSMNSKHPLETESSPDKESVCIVNLEDLVTIESHLSLILEKFSTPRQILPLCEDIWDITAQNTLNKVSSLYRDAHTKETIKYSMVLQAVGVSLAHFFISEYTLNQDMALLIKSILFSIHQGFLIFTKFILSRVPADNSNQWALRLRELIKQKKLRKHHIDSTEFLEHYNQLIVNNLKKMCRNFISRSEDPTVKLLKLAVLSIVRNRSIEISEARNLIENAFGIRREELGQTAYESSTPYLKTCCDKVYTLVLDMDETLVHYIDSQSNGKYLLRPFIQEFLQELSRDFEIVVFTAAVKEYADWILDGLDKASLISHRLYRSHTIAAGNYFLKDLRKLGRDLSKVIIVDNVAENFQLQSENGIHIKSWYEDPNDTALQELKDFLLLIPRQKVEDVRIYLQEMRAKMLSDKLN